MRSHRGRPNLPEVGMPLWAVVDTKVQLACAHSLVFLVGLQLGIMSNKSRMPGSFSSPNLANTACYSAPSSTRYPTPLDCHADPSRPLTGHRPGRLATCQPGRPALAAKQPAPVPAPSLVRPDRMVEGGRRRHRLAWKCYMYSVWMVYVCACVCNVMKYHTSQRPGYMRRKIRNFQICWLMHPISVRDRNACSFVAVQRNLSCPLICSRGFQATDGSRRRGESR